MTHYDILGIDRTATMPEIRAAFRRLAQKNHPDKGGEHIWMQRIQEAYDVLGDPAKRKEYDETGEVKLQQSLRTKAVKVIAASMAEIMEAADVGSISFATVDPLSYIRRDVRVGLAEATRKQTEIKKAIARRQEALDRLDEKTPADGVVQGVIQALMRELERHLKQAEAEAALATEVLDVLACYRYNVEEEQHANL